MTIGIVLVASLAARSVNRPHWAASTPPGYG
jgi:hypothetical protein